MVARRNKLSFPMAMPGGCLTRRGHGGHGRRWKWYIHLRNLFARRRVFELLYAFFQARDIVLQDTSLRGVRSICVFTFIVSIGTGTLSAGRLDSVAFLTLRCQTRESMREYVHI